MVYKVIGVMSGSSGDGLDITFAEFQEQSGRWNYEIICAECISYEKIWQEKLQNATFLSAKDYLLLDVDFGRFIGEKINDFISRNKLSHQVNLISSHGHTTFHLPANKMTHQLGEGASIAAVTRLAVVTNLRAIDIAFGGQGAPIVPLGEKLLFGDYNYFLNIGGIANLSINEDKKMVAFDICAANRVLNLLAQEKGFAFDNKGNLASLGKINKLLLQKLNSLNYYELTFPKSLANSFGTNIVYPIVQSFEISIEDKLATYCEHISYQIKKCLERYGSAFIQKLFVTGGGAFNNFLVETLAKTLKAINFEIFIPDDAVIKYKEALIMGLLGALRWREQFTVLATVTGASQNSIGGALWLGTEA